MKLEHSWLKAIQGRPDGGLTLKFELTEEFVADFSARLSSVLTEDPADSETILRFEPVEGQSWILFVKKRPRESRALFAHPDVDQWVGTLALEEAVLRKWREAIVTRVDFSLSSLCRLARPSNLDMEFTFR